MSRTSINFVLDSGLLFVFTGLVWSSVVVRFVFPPAYESRGWQLWGLGLNEWMNIQFAMLSLLALGVLIHVMLHWSWVCGVITSRLSRGKKAKLDDGVQTIWGVGLLIVIFNILGVAIAVAAIAIQEPRLRAALPRSIINPFNSISQNADVAKDKLEGPCPTHHCEPLNKSHPCVANPQVRAIRSEESSVNTGV